MTQRSIHKIDATNQAVGRLATRIAIILRGKDVPEFIPNIDQGGIVYVSNVEKVKMTGKKMEQKKYFSYSGYPGGLKTKKMGEVMAKKPAEVLKRAVRKMLPDNRLRDKMLKRLIIK